MAHNVYRFGAGEADGRADQTQLLGGKGANLAEMTSLGIPVPPGFTLTTDICSHYRGSDGRYPDGLEAQVASAMVRVGELTGTSFGDAVNPLLVSVRSGAPVSMPGMMDTILNLGLNDETVIGLVNQTGDARFAYDCYRRFVAMYGEVVMGVAPAKDGDKHPFELLLEAAKESTGSERDTDLSAEALKTLVTEYKIEILRQTERSFPEDPAQQLWGAMSAVFRSWDTARARAYREIHNIDDSLGTAVNIQAMVFGNMGEDCATGVAFTRHPSTGERAIYGEYLTNAQGEDVIAGMRTPEPITQLATGMPIAYEELAAVCDRLERHFRDMQDLEFTVQRGKLWLLQTRTGKRTARAMVRIAVDMVAEEMIDQRTAIQRVDPHKLDELMHPTVDEAGKPAAIASGLKASPGAAVGRVVFTAADAESWRKRGESVVLVRIETRPEDILGMNAAVGVLTARGGMTSHAAVVARGMGKPCVAGCSSLQVDFSRGRFIAGDTTVKLGDTITIDGSTGDVFASSVALRPAQMDEYFRTFMAWVDDARRLKVRTNADTPADARSARAFGAEGIGLCRTEHMFFAPERVSVMRQMILARDQAGRRAALDAMLPMQRSDFAQIFREMDGLPVTVRLLDPPLHEFLPHEPEEIAEIAGPLGMTVADLKAAIATLHEVNPMLGHRGCRLAISYPEIYATQTRAIAEAAVLVTADGVDVRPEIMIPLVSTPDEIMVLRRVVGEAFDQVLADTGSNVSYRIGAMIELPRACVVADRIAAHADFISFGTNDLTQTTYGFSRDDASVFIGQYLAQGILLRDPFVALDREGVGQLIRLAVERGRKVKTKLKVGICGEHGGEPSSVEFCHVEGFDYVSCSPFRVPIARVAAAQAALAGEARGR